MKDKFFVDSNIFLYLFSNNQAKSNIAMVLLENSPIISSQVIVENINICQRKFKLSKEESFVHAANLLKKCHLTSIHDSTFELAFSLSLKYQYSFLDSLIVSVALENNCKVLYSEDFQHNQIIDKELKIVNPFI